MIHAGDFAGGSGFMNLESALGEGFLVQFFRTGKRELFEWKDGRWRRRKPCSSPRDGRLHRAGPVGRRL